ncbi:uncharacterized protein LOC118646697 [Monomorium pharaonis]|uniref:uncharacterized protein LOC118646697 n=1 Tax=Monomorium pharaonis TaxID=307658 RepID=UPI001746B86F|nr:uncharacterized protein LOC118646697 [Monomorium pharaonis]
MSNKSDLVHLKRRRSIIKSSCTRIKTYVESISVVNSVVISQLEERKIKLDQYWQEYDNVQTQIEISEEIEDNDRAAFEEAFYNLSAKIRNLLRSTVVSHPNVTISPSPSNASDASPASCNVRLPKLDLPKFSGRYDEWFPFYNAFLSVIHSNASLNDIHKLQYLRAAITGEAHELICALEMSDANYEVAWSLLKERYDNKRLVVENHLKAIVGLPSMTKENAIELRQITHGTTRHMQALKALKRPVHEWDDLLIHILVSKLDPTTSREWKMTLTGDVLPTLKQLLEFLSHRCQVLESSSRSSNLSGKATSLRAHSNDKQKLSCNAVTKSKCDVCQGEHSIHQCKQFLSLTIPKRIESARRHKICLNCLKAANHSSSQCPSGNCRICSRKHNTLLHLQDENSTGNKPKQEDHATEPTATAVVTHSSSVAPTNNVLLSTAVLLADGRGKSQRPCRALLDSGSQVNFVTKDLVASLGLTPRLANTAISGINGTTTQASQTVQITLHSRLNSFSMDIDCIVTDQITDYLPTFTLERSAFDIPRNLPLADPKFNVSSKIDVLIGAETFWKILCIGQIKASPILQKTRLGWVLAGKCDTPSPRSSVVKSFHASVTNARLHDQLNKFWVIDTFKDGSSNYTLEEKVCEKHFVETVTRNDQGRYVVKLPVKQEVLDNLGDSREIALRRLHSLERRFRNNSHLKLQYSAFMSEYLALGHMKPIDEDPSSLRAAYYLPHHCVLKEDAKTTKLRVVFDGSCKTNTDVSLNDCLMTGPVVQQDLISILMRFRTFRYAMVADIIKMYRQVLIHPSQTHLQRILWREEPSLNVTPFELTTVTYGTTSASYLATRCLQDLAERYMSVFPVGSLHLKRDFYVDDLLTGADSKSEAKFIRDQILQLLKLGNFELSKWASNCPELLHGINNQDEKLISLDLDSDFKLLGILWDRDNDTFLFSHDSSQLSQTVTKRSLLAEVSRLFDPLGLLGPIIVIAKILLQDLWQAGTNWDESIPQEIHTRWIQFRLQLPNLTRVRIPRCVKQHTDSKFIQLHGYCDASQRAYDACVYIRTRMPSNEYQSHLLCSKSRVAPLKAISLPRLELSAALLLSQLVNKIKSSIDIKDIKIWLWSDSTITLNWITSPSRKWSTFVANRVGEIQDLTKTSSWRHVASTDNPADLLSRGLLTNDLINSEIWWHGPSYLKLPENQWPSGNFDLIANDMPEQKKQTNVALAMDGSITNDLLNRTSSLNKACRILAYCLRFLKSNTVPKPSITVNPTEISNSLDLFCRIAQRQAFPNEYKALKGNQDLCESSSLLCLSPFMTDDDLIRVGGQLGNSTMKFDVCHQIVLPKSHIVTKRVIEYEHLRNFHSGVLATMAAVRQRFWPLSLKSTTRIVIRQCVTCFKARPTFSETLMGPLPAPRVTVSRPFSHCGIDYAGPMTLREGKRRNSRNHKAYVAVFVCFATKAIHLELVSDLTTDAFIAAFKRLISRRGKPTCMYSDNATTFVGAQRLIKELYDFIKTPQFKSVTENFLREHQITWNFIPPNAPHFGGLWEAAVKSAKFHLTRIVGGVHLTFEEMQTTFCEIEAILNSRPLSPLSSDPNDMTFLSPGHFLVGAPLNSLPSTDLSEVKVNLLSRWQLIEQLRQHFWSRWSREYLSSLQERNKWRLSKGTQLQTGQLVLVKQPGMAPLYWLTGRIEKVYEGADGMARSALVKTSKGSYVRPLIKLAILPIQPSDSSQ